MALGRLDSGATSAVDDGEEGERPSDDEDADVVGGGGPPMYRPASVSQKQRSFCKTYALQDPTK